MESNITTDTLGSNATVTTTANEMPNKETLSFQNLDLAAIGNCSYSALVDKKASIVWSCYPRFDGDPIFCSLVRKSRVGPAQSSRESDSSEIGFFDIRVQNFSHSEQQYLRNSAVLSTKLYDKQGNCLEVIDFIPRFESFDREFRPNMLIRIVQPIKGRPRAQIRLRPTFGYGWGTPEKTRGSNHIRYLLSTMTIRLTTNAPISYVVDEVFFEITESLYLSLMPDESMKSSLEETSRTFLSKTLGDWRDWVKALTIPFEWQDDVIRSCITLKLNNFEETGAIVAAMTTSIPNGKNGLNFDYRYCWLRDSYWVVRVLNELGATDNLENYLRFLKNIVSELSASEEHEKRLQPVYGISLESRLHEREMHRLSGYRAMGPVVLGTADAESVQHDVYGSVILALTQSFFDRRIEDQGSELLFTKMEELGERAVWSYDQPDAGPSGRKLLPKVHTFSSVMCWAACDRLAKIALKLNLNDKAAYWQKHADTIHAAILKNAWCQKLNSFSSTWGGEEVDAFVLLLPQIRFLDPKDSRFLSTLALVEQRLKKDKFVLSFENDTTAHNSATFWYINALAAVGRGDEARSLFECMLSNVNHIGLLSETIDSTTKELWGNFPQSIAMVGLINCAITLSKPWKGAF